MRSIVVAFEMSGDIERVREAYPRLSIQDIQGALDFYADNKQEIDQYIDENEAISYT